MNQLNTAILSIAATALLFALLRPSSSSDQDFGQRGMTPAGLTAPVPSQPGTLECFAAKLWAANGEEVSAGKIPKTVHVPAGWSVMGGTTVPFTVTGTTPVPAMVLCREVPPPAPPKELPHAEPLGRCSGRDVAEMLERGMTKVVIEKACSSP